MTKQKKYIKINKVYKKEKRVTMDIKDKIRSLKERLLKKNEMACPTPVLLYLAAQWNYLPVVQIIAQELRKNVQLEGEHPLEFSVMMKYLDYDLKRGADKNTPPERNDYTFPQERYNIAKQIFDMQKTGIISDNFQVKKWNEFISSDLIQNFPYNNLHFLS